MSMQNQVGQAGTLDDLLLDVRACTVCEAHLPLGPRPIVQAGSTSRVVIIGQAPGRAVHESGVPWDDPSGRRLREWLGLTSDEFYDPDIVALLPMGLCFPGSKPSGDAPPRPECAPLWHDRVLDLLPRLRLRIIIGKYAIDRYVPDSPPSVTEAVRRWLDDQGGDIVLPHPSPRNQRWLRNNPWFADIMLPLIQARVRDTLAAT